MTITPEQARELLAGATPGPWVKRRDQDGDPLPVVVSTPRGERHHVMTAEPAAAPERQQADTALIAAAPDLAQTIAALRWEYGVELHYTFDGKCRVGWWGEESSARSMLAHPENRTRNPRLVRRLAGPVEVVE